MAKRGKVQIVVGNSESFMNEVAFPRGLKRWDIILTGRDKKRYGACSEVASQHKKVKMEDLFYQQ